MSGAAWVRERLEAAGWMVEIADARKVKALAPLAADKQVDARVLAELARRDLVPALLGALTRRACAQGRLLRRMHLAAAHRRRTAPTVGQFGVKRAPGCASPMRSAAGAPRCAQVWRHRSR